MSATLVSSATGAVNWTYSNALAGGLNSANTGSFNASVSLTNGTGGAGSANLIYAAQLSIAPSANTALILTSSLTDFFGAIISMARVKILFVQLVANGNAQPILVGNGSNPFINWITPSSAAIQVRNGGFALLACSDATAYQITAGSGDQLKFTNNDGALTASVNVALIGSTA